MNATQSKPVAAYTIAIVGVALQVVAALFMVYIVFFPSPFNEGMWFYPMMGSWTMHGRDGNSLGLVWVSVSMAIMIAVVGLGAYGSVSMNSSKLDNVRSGAILVLVSAVIAFPTMWGFFAGSLLRARGSLLGLTWQP